MQILIWVMTGALAGWMAGKLMKGRDYGLSGNMILGLLGGIVGGWLLRLLGATGPVLWWQQVLTSALGALVLLGAARRFRPIARQTRSVIGEVAAAGVDLEAQIRKLSEFERRVVTRALQGHKATDPNDTFDQQLTFGQRTADKVATFGGSWTFIGLFLLFMLVDGHQYRNRREVRSVPVHPAQPDPVVPRGTSGTRDHDEPKPAVP